MSQPWVKAAPIDIVFVAERTKTSSVYGERAKRYVDMEVGHASQNIYLQVVPLGLGTVAVGACDDDRLGRVLGLADGQIALYVMPIGRIAKVK
jgi:SagB-type dehydrogenase family enzyme